LRISVPGKARRDLSQVPAGPQDDPLR
jgi:hypothetical protein